MNPSTTSLKSRPLRAAVHTAAASMALMTANAAITYVDNLDSTLTSIVAKNDTQGPLFSTAISINGTPVFTANLQSDTTLESPSTISIDNRLNGFVAYGVAGKGGNPVAVFSSGNTIPPAVPVLATDFATNFSNFYSALAATETAFIGFEFNPSGSQTLYGWMEFRMDAKFSANNSFTLTRYAYDDSGASITAGAIPEPSGVLLISLAGAAGLLRRRR